MAFVRTAALIAVTLLGATPSSGDDVRRKLPIATAELDTPVAEVDVAQPDASEPDSRSVGLPYCGRLEGGRALEGSPILRFQANTPPEQRFATDELRAMLQRTAEQLHATVPGAPLLVGDLSRDGGGYMFPHRSHRTGRDADIALFAQHVKGQPVKLDRFVRFRRDGTARLLSQVYMFDDKRNWELVRTLLDDPTAEVEYIFIDSHLRTRLLAEAARRGEPQALVDRAAELMQSRGGGHDDHMHVRIRCPAGDTGCRG